MHEVGDRRWVVEAWHTIEGGMLVKINGVKDVSLE
jgi:hypothetical protein